MPIADVAAKRHCTFFSTHNYCIELNNINHIILCLATIIVNFLVITSIRYSTYIFHHLFHLFSNALVLIFSEIDTVIYRFCLSFTIVMIF